MPTISATRLIVALTLVTGCQSQIDLSVYGEAFVEEGIPAAEVSDGWRVEFEEFVIAVTDVRIEGEEAVELEGSWVFDLARPSDGAGHLLATLPVDRGEYDTLEYRFARPTGEVAGNATDAQVARAVETGSALLVEATATRDDRNVHLSWAFPLDQGHRCELNLQARREGADAEITVHADHLLLDDVSVDPEIAVTLIADADADGDGIVTTTELAAVDITTESRYQTDGLDIRDLHRYVGHLALTMGHVNGEGGCEPQFTPRRYRALYDSGEVDLANADEAEGEGETLFATHCASCHGASGQGDGPAGVATTPQAADLTRLAAGAQEPAYLHFRIAEGGAFFPYMSTMPPLADVLDDAQTAAIVAHVRMLSGAHETQ